MLNKDKKEKPPSSGDFIEGIAPDSDQSMALTIDYALYERYLDDCDLTDKQKREFLDNLWNFIVCFVDLGFGVHPLQQACGQKFDIAALPSFVPENVVASSIQHKNIFSRIAGYAKESIVNKSTERKSK